MEERQLKELRKFAFIMSAGFALIGGLFLIKNSPWYPFILAASGVFLGWGILAPRRLKPVFHVWMLLASGMGWVMTRVILGIVYYLILTPIGVIFRCFGKQFLQQKFNPEADTYWIHKEKKLYKQSDYEQQF